MLSILFSARQELPLLREAFLSAKRNNWEREMLMQIKSFSGKVFQETRMYIWECSRNNFSTMLSWVVCTPSAKRFLVFSKTSDLLPLFAAQWSPPQVVSSDGAPCSSGQCVSSSRRSPAVVFWCSSPPSPELGCSSQWQPPGALCAECSPKQLPVVPRVGLLYKKGECGL